MFPESRVSSHDYIYNYIDKKMVWEKRQCVLKLKTLCPDLELLDTEDGDVRRFGLFFIDFEFVCLLLHTLCTIMVK